MNRPAMTGRASSVGLDDEQAEGLEPQRGQAIPVAQGPSARHEFRPAGYDAHTAPESVATWHYPFSAARWGAYPAGGVWGEGEA
jgi:hypothetical protein